MLEFSSDCGMMHTNPVSERYNSVFTKTEIQVRSFSILLALVFFALVCTPAKLGAQAAAPPASDMAGKTAGQYYKNLKVLKDIPAENLHPAMEYITVALGVGCGNCHDVRKFDSDDKANKRTARGMMQMEFALNNAIFEGKTRVTCYTCHRGQPEGAAAQVFPGDTPLAGTASVGTYLPLAVPNIMLDSSMAVVRTVPGVPAAAPPAPAAPPKPAVVLPPVAEVMAKYIQSLGSADAVRKASTLVETGSVELEIPNPPGTPGPPKVGRVDAEVDRKAPNKVLYQVHIASGVSVEGYDGSMAWLKMNAAREVTGGERTVMQERAEFFPVQRFKDTHSQVTVQAIETIGNRQAYRVSGLRQDAAGYDYFDVDSENGQLLHLSTYMVSVIGSFPVDIDYSDYREVNGLKLPFTVREASPEGERIYRWDKIVFNGPVDDSVFNKPAPPPPAAAPPAPR
jgi:photosynthetic reaction center cytochrome c subunit